MITTIPPRKLLKQISSAKKYVCWMLVGVHLCKPRVLSPLCSLPLACEDSWGGGWENAKIELNVDLYMLQND